MRHQFLLIILIVSRFILSSSNINLNKAEASNTLPVANVVLVRCAALLILIPFLLRSALIRDAISSELVGGAQRDGAIYRRSLPTAVQMSGQHPFRAG